MTHTVAIRSHLVLQVFSAIPNSYFKIIILYPPTVVSLLFINPFMDSDVTQLVYK